MEREELRELDPPSLLTEIILKVLNVVKHISRKFLSNSRFSKILKMCLSMKVKKQTTTHLFYECQYTSGVYWQKIETYLYTKTTYRSKLEANDVILYDVNKIHKVQRTVNQRISQGEFHIHKSSFLKSRSSFELFRMEFKKYFESIQMINNEKLMQSVCQEHVMEIGALCLLSC